AEQRLRLRPAEELSRDVSLDDRRADADACEGGRRRAARIGRLGRRHRRRLDEGEGSARRVQGDHVPRHQRPQDRSADAVSDQYELVSRWRVEASCGEVADVLGDPLALPRWWPAVYLDARETAAGDARGLGRRVALHTKGWLPYTLCWELEIVESNYPN